MCKPKVFERTHTVKGIATFKLMAINEEVNLPAAHIAEAMSMLQQEFPIDISAFGPIEVMWNGQKVA